MKKTLSSILTAAALCLTAAGGTVALTTTVAHAQAKPLDAPRSSGVVGERYDGYAVVRDSSAPAEIRKLVEGTNAERRKVYTEQATAKGRAGRRSRQGLCRPDHERGAGRLVVPGRRRHLGAEEVAPTSNDVGEGPSFRLCTINCTGLPRFPFLPADFGLYYRRNGKYGRPERSSPWASRQRFTT